MNQFLIYCFSRSDITPYERQINLDQHLERKKPRKSDKRHLSPVPNDSIPKKQKFENDPPDFDRIGIPAIVLHDKLSEHDDNMRYRPEVGKFSRVFIASPTAQVYEGFDLRTRELQLGDGSSDGTTSVAVGDEPTHLSSGLRKSYLDRHYVPCDLSPISSQTQGSTEETHSCVMLPTYISEVENKLTDVVDVFNLNFVDGSSNESIHDLFRYTVQNVSEFLQSQFWNLTFGEESEKINGVLPSREEVQIVEPGRAFGVRSFDPTGILKTARNWSEYNSIYIEVVNHFISPTQHLWCADITPLTSPQYCGSESK